jgi:hypothetical protein
MQQFGPASLSPGKEFSGGKVLKVLVVRDDINGFGRTLNVVSPGTEGFKDGEEFFVMGIIIELRSCECTGVGGYWTKFLVRTYNEKYSGDSIVRSICFYNNKNIRHPMGEDWS